MLCGSSRVLTPRISPMSGGLFDMCRNCGFIAPMPCSAEIEPRRAATHSYTKGSMAPSTAALGSNTPGVWMLRCRLPSPRWPKPLTSAPSARIRGRISSTRSYEGTLGADEELAHVVPGVVLAQRREIVEQRAIGQHRLQTEHRAAEGAVAQEAEPARVGREVASYLARALGSEVEGHGEAACGHVLLERLEDAAGLACQTARRLVQRQDAAHP
mmetsp:Transcript_24588/g.62430  ORF Transcript_24588/g.62430 Transcript_24588/m.62430 type:complete len:214 (-) Transcript_24588:343-984(-)